MTARKRAKIKVKVERPRTVVHSPQRLMGSMSLHHDRRGVNVIYRDQEGYLRQATVTLHADPRGKGDWIVVTLADGRLVARMHGGSIEVNKDFP